MNKPKVLIVDDDKAYRQMIKADIEALEADFIEAANGVDALEKIIQVEFAVILLDVDLPDLNGFEVAEIMREKTVTPIIFITGQYTEQSFVFKGYEAGGIDYLIKPYSGMILKSKVQVFLTLYEQKRQLLQSSKMEALGILAGGIAHDFNNILATILASSEMLSMNLHHQHPVMVYVKNINKSAERATVLIKQILTYCCKETSRFTPLNLAVEIKEVLNLARASIPSQIEIHHQLDEQSQVMADASQMQQLVLNLCSNACHAMEKKGGRLDVILQQITPCPLKLDTEDERCLKLTIKDTGTGIEEENLQDVFNPFFTTKSVNKGTGLGLSVVQGIVEKHGGKIEVYSKVATPENSGGTTVEVYLPISVQDGNKKIVQKNDAKNIAVRSNALNILLVEDEMDLAVLYREFLLKQGHQIRLCKNGIQALEIFETDPDAFDLVLTDHNMPKMTGQQLAVQLLSIRPTLPIILLTGYSDTFGGEDAKAMGIKKYLIKPLSYNALDLAISDCLRE